MNKNMKCDSKIATAMLGYHNSHQKLEKRNLIESNILPRYVSWLRQEQETDFRLREFYVKP